MQAQSQLPPRETDEQSPKKSSAPTTATTTLPAAQTVVKFTRNKYTGRLQIQRQHEHQQQLRNNLLAFVGYLELANAGDFAANVWNQIPVPRYAVVLMAIGGGMALLMSVFTLWDFQLGWRNVRLLRAERARLHQAIDEHAYNNNSIHQREKEAEDNNIRLHSRLGVNFRELGTEVVDRLIMDALGGVSVLMIGTGTLMAIWGEESHTIFTTSNLLSGYLGNSLTLLFGLVNGIWSAYLVLRFRRLHVAAAVKSQQLVVQSRGVIHRCQVFERHASINGVTGLVAGAAAMITATRWWAYVILIPCICSTIAFSHFWRWKIGYDRPLFWPLTQSQCPPPPPPLDEELSYVTDVVDALTSSNISLPISVADTNSLPSMLDLIARNSMFDAFCEWMIGNNKKLRELILSMAASTTTTEEEKAMNNIIILAMDDLLKLDNNADMLFAVCEFLRHVGRRIFVYRERYLSELVLYATYYAETVDGWDAS